MVAGTSQPADAGSFARDGYFVHFEPLLPKERLERATALVEAIIRGDRHFPGAEKGYAWDSAARRGSLLKIDNPHRSDSELLELCTFPSIVSLAVRLVSAELLQMWCSQLLVKLPNRIPLGGIGWHRDYDYWSQGWTPDSELFTVWVALNGVTSDSGPVAYVAGSHRWEVEGPGDFFSEDLEATRRLFARHDRAWEERPAILPAGGAVVHDWKTVHASGSNTGSRPRIGLAIHFRTNRSTLKPGIDPSALELQNGTVCPIVYRSEGRD